jgi:F-type H+-transporting ATPase subunit b
MLSCHVEIIFLRGANMRIGIIFVLVVILCTLPAAVLAAEAGAEDEAGPFSGTPADAVWAVIQFLLLLVILWWLLWKPLLLRLNEREEHIAKQIKDAEDTSKEAKAVLEDYRSKLAGAEEEGRKIVTRHKDKAGRDAKEIVMLAREKADAIKVKAEADIIKAQQKAQAELLNEAGDIVLKLGKDVLGRAIDNKDNQKLIDNAVQRLKAEGGNQ